MFEGKKAKLDLTDERALKTTLNSDPCYAAAALMTVIAINGKVSQKVNNYSVINFEQLKIWIIKNDQKFIS